MESPGHDIEMETEELFVDVGPEFEQFANILDDCLSLRLPAAASKQRLLQAPQKYYENAKIRLNQLRHSLRHNARVDLDMETDDADGLYLETSPQDEQLVQRVESEVETWDLLRRILPLRYSSAANDLFSVQDGEFMAAFLEANPKAREHRAVLQWLQSNASSRPNIDDLVRELQQNAGRDDIIGHGWLHTRAAIKQRKSVTGWPHLLDRQSPQITQSFINKDGAPMVTQLDPDVKSRQGRKIEKQDEFFERAIWLGCFEHLRRGSSIQSIRDWCEDRTELWRAVSMSAMPLSLDPREEETSDSDPSALCLWRRMCLTIARQGGSDDYERAIYGVLSGDIATVEQVATTWDDYLFASYNGLLRSELDSFALERCPADSKSRFAQSFAHFDAAQYLGGSGDVEKQVIESLAEREALREEASESHKALQSALLGRTLDAYLSLQGSELRESKMDDSMSDVDEEERPSPDLDELEDPVRCERLRIQAHAYLIHLVLEHGFGHSPRPLLSSWQTSAQAAIISQYTRLLWKSNHKELIPLYCVMLPREKCYEILSASFIREKSPVKRKLFMQLMTKTGIDPDDFVRVQAKMLHRQLLASGDPNKIEREQFRLLGEQEPAAGSAPRLGKTIKENFFLGEEDKVEPLHVRVVRSLEWLKESPRSWPLLFSLGTSTYKYFLRNMCLNAGREIKENVTFAAAMANLNEEDLTNMDFVYNPEYWSNQLEANDITGFSGRQVMEDARNFRDLEALVKALDHLETVAGWQVLYEEVPASSRRAFWDKVSREANTGRTYMEPLLENWLDISVAEGDSELAQIRKVYLPETILAYISSLQFAGTGITRDHLLECMELAATIASKEREGLANMIKEAGRMKELVEAFASCSKALAVMTGEKRATGSGNKKLREMGWSRDVWSVKS